MPSKETYKCDKCNKTFPYRSYFTRHSCGSYRRAIQRQSESKYSNNPNCRYACPRCSKTFIFLSHLNSHLRKGHSDNAAKTVYHCRICNATSNRKDNMQQHMRRVHLKPSLERRKQTPVGKFKSDVLVAKYQSVHCCAIENKVHPNAMRRYIRTCQVVDGFVYKQLNLDLNSTCFIASPDFDPFQFVSDIDPPRTRVELIFKDKMRQIELELESPDTIQTTTSGLNHD